MTFEELCEKKKKMEDDCNKYNSAVHDFLEQCIEEAGFKGIQVIPKHNPSLVGRLYVEYVSGSQEIVFRKITKKGSVSKNSSYISGLSYSQWFDRFPMITSKLKEIFEPAEDSE